MLRKCSLNPFTESKYVNNYTRKQSAPHSRENGVVSGKSQPSTEQFSDLTAIQYMDTYTMLRLYNSAENPNTPVLGDGILTEMVYSCSCKREEFSHENQVKHREILCNHPKNRRINVENYNKGYEKNVSGTSKKYPGR